MANGFDPNDPTQLTRGNEGQPQGGAPQSRFFELNPDLAASLNQVTTDPEELAKMENEKRQADFDIIDRAFDLGFDADRIVGMMGNWEGYNEADVRATMYAKYEIDAAAFEEEQERQRKQRDKREAEKAERDKKWTESLEDFEEVDWYGHWEDGEAATSQAPWWLQAMGIESVPWVESSHTGLHWYNIGSGYDWEQSMRDAGYDDEQIDAVRQFNPMSMANRSEGAIQTAQGIQGATAQHITIQKLQHSLSDDYNKSAIAYGLLKHLTDGNMEDADELLAMMKEDGSLNPIFDNYDLSDPATVEGLKTMAVRMQDNSDNRAREKMTQLSAAYGDMGIEYNLNPESDVDLHNALLEASKFKSRADEYNQGLQEFLRISKEAEFDYNILYESWGGGGFGNTAAKTQEVVGGWVDGLEGSFRGLQALYYDGVLDERKAEYYGKKAQKIQSYTSAFHAARNKAQFADNPEVRNMGLWESITSDKASWGDSGVKAFNTFGEVLPDVVIAAVTMGRGSLIKQAGKEALEEAGGMAVKKFSSRYFGTQARKDATRQIMTGQLMTKGTAGFFGLRSAGSTYASVRDRKDMSYGQKLFLSTVVGGAEAVMSSIFTGAEQLGMQGIRNAMTGVGSSEARKTAMRQALRGLRKRDIWAKAGKSIGAEWLEEASIEAVDQATRYLIDWSNGREPEPIDYYAIMDAGLGGLLGAVPGSTFGAATSHMAHSKIQNSRTIILAELDKIDDRIRNSSDPTTQTNLRKKRARLFKMLALTDSQGAKEYDKLTEAELKEVNAINRELAQIKDEIDVEKDAGTRKKLEERFGNLYERKLDIEQGAKERPSVPRASVDQDAEGNDVNSQQNDMTDQTRRAHENMPEADHDNDFTTSGQRISSLKSKVYSAFRTIGRNALGKPGTDRDGQDVKTKKRKTTKGAQTKAINALKALGYTDGQAKRIVNELTQVENELARLEGTALNEAGIQKLDALKKRKQRLLNMVGVQEAAQQSSPEAEAQADAETETQERGAPMEDNSVDVDLDEGIDFNANWIGGGPGKIPLVVASQIQRMMKAFGKALKAGGIRVKIHLTQESFDLATGKKGSKGFYDTSDRVIHLNPNSSKADVQEEFGHSAFRFLVNSDPAIRNALYNDLLKLAGNPKTKADGTVDTSEFIDRNPETGKPRWKIDRRQIQSMNPVLRLLIEQDVTYSDYSTENRMEEAVMTALTAYSRNPKPFNETKGFVKRIVSSINRALRKAGFKGNFLSTQDGFLSFADKFALATSGLSTEIEGSLDPKQDITKTDSEKQEEAKVEETTTEEAPAEEAAPEVEEAQPTEVEEKRADESPEEFQQRLEREANELLGAETEEQKLQREFEEEMTGTSGLEARRIDIEDSVEPNLSGAEIVFEYTGYMSMWNGLDKPFYGTRRVKVNDYTHFKNLYAKLTGNGDAPARMEVKYYIRDGVKYNVTNETPGFPPKPTTDYRGNRRKMSVPYLKNPRELTLEARMRASNLQEELRGQMRSLRNELMDLMADNDKNLTSYVQTDDFNPLYVSSIDRPFGAQGESEVLEQIEGMAIAKKNIQALLDSDISEQDLATLKGNSWGISKTKHPSIFNMSGLTPFSQSGVGSSVGDGKPQNLDGMESRKVDIELGTDIPIGDMKADIGGLNGIVSGFDRTGNFSGVSGLFGKTMEVAGKTYGVITAHRGAREARYKFDALGRQVRNTIREKNLKNGDTGFVYHMVTLLSPKSSLGNPAVFSSLVQRLVNDGDSSSAIASLNSALNSKSVSGRIRTALFDYATTKNLSSLQNAVSIQGRVNIQNDAQLEEALTALTEIDGNIGLELGFKARAEVIKKLYPEQTKTNESTESLLEDFHDPVWSDTNIQSTEVVAYTKIPFIVDSNAPTGFTGFKTGYIEGDAFAGVLRTDGTAGDIELKLPGNSKGEMVIPLVSEIMPDLSIRTDKTKKKRIKDDPETGERRFKEEDVRKPISELEGQEAIKATEELGRISAIKGKVTFDNVNDFESRSVNIEGLESRDGMTDVQNDEGQTWQVREKTWFQQWRGKWLRRLADKYYDVMGLQSDIEKAKGMSVKESQDFKMAEERMYGKAAFDLEKLEKKTQKITALMKKLGLKQGEITDYLYALHAKERNALIKERDGKDNGSGMTDAEADAILNGLTDQQKSNMNQVVDILRDIQQDTRNTMVELGLESQETIDRFEGQFDNYVPLGGIATDEMGSDGAFYPTGGAGMSVQGATYKKAAGRKSKAENLVAQIISQNASTHIQGRTNEALNSLYELVSNNPNEGVWSIVDKANYGDAHVVPVRIKGEQKYIRFKDSSYAETLKGMSVPRTSALVKILRAPANLLRRSFTTLNPEFIISNFSRDIQSAIFNAMAESDIEGGLLLGTNAFKDIMKNIGPSLKGLLKVNNPAALGKLFKDNPLIEKYYEEFQEDGGKTGWGYAKSLQQIASEIESETGEKSTAQNIWGKVENFAEGIEGVNDAFENSIRLSTYIAARENGVSRAKAAQLAKNVTVNFNKHGEYGQALNAVYLFFNASIQGTMRLGRSLLGSKPARPDGIKESWMKRRTNAQKIASGLVVFNGMLTIIARAMSGEDEDGVLFYDKIPDYVKERNMIIMIDEQNYIKIPMPYGFNIFANLGSAAVDVAEGGKEIDEAMLFLGNSFMGAFSPVSFGQSKDLFTSVGKGATPTVLRPLVEIMTNETYFGGPVYAEQSPYSAAKPESSMSFRSPRAMQQFFSWMNEATGGSKDVPGAIDMNPDKFWHIFDYYLGGAGQFVTRSMETTYKMGQKLFVDDRIEVQFNDLPMIRRMYGEPSKYYDMEKFRENEAVVTRLLREYKGDERSEDLDRYKGLRPLSQKLKQYQKLLKKIRKAKREAKEITNYAERSVRIQELQDAERRVVMDFNRLYEKYRD